MYIFFFFFFFPFLPPPQTHTNSLPECMTLIASPANNFNDIFCNTEIAFFYLKYVLNFESHLFERKKCTYM